MLDNQMRLLGRAFSKRDLLRAAMLWAERDRWNWHEAAYKERLRAGLPDDGGEIGREFYAMAIEAVDNMH